MKTFINQHHLPQSFDASAFFAKFPTEDKIRRKAYEIWESKGRPMDNNANDDWLEAEYRLRHEQ